MEKNLNLQLGDIIELFASSNLTLHKKIFFIKYIDQNKLLLINNETELVLHIKDNKELYEESIESINILSRSDSPSYATQNKLLPNTWVSIYFSGTLPLIINGIITNLENDMIEIKTYPKNEYIYIDFEYKGIPETLNIEKIKIIDSITDKQESIGDPSSVDSKLDTKTEYQDQIKEYILEADAIELGDELEEITQVINVTAEKLRYSISKQLDDLLDDMLSNIPNINRTSNTLKNIHLQIERFRELRLKFSELDDHNNINGLRNIGSNFNPLIDNFIKMNNKLMWILPIVINKKRIYDVNITDIDNISNESLANLLSNINTEIEMWKSNQYINEQNKYKYFINKVSELFKPFYDIDLDTVDYLYNMHINNNFDFIVDNLGDLKNYGISKNQLSSNIFDVTSYNTSLTMIESIQDYNNNNKLNKLINISKNDLSVIKSIMLLPKQVFHFSNINLPHTNILERSNLNQKFLSYKQILNNNTIVNTNIIDISGNNLFYNKNPILFNKIHHFIPDKYNKTSQTALTTKSSNDSEDFAQFLNECLPTKNIIFKYLSTTLINKYNITDLLLYIQPFLIDSENLIHDDLLIIQNIIHKNIINYRKILNKNIGKSDNKSKQYINKNSVVDLILSDIQPEVIELYNLTEINKNRTNSELLSQMIHIDNGKLFFMAFNKSIVNIIIADLLNRLVKISEKNKQGQHESSDANSDEADASDTDTSKLSKETPDKPEEIIKAEPAISESASKCNKYVLSKKYLELDELENDNNKPIYFDKQYDKTIYDIINEYKQEQNTMNPEEFLNFLTDKLITNIGLSKENAERDAKAMTDGRREVLDNDYAVLISTNDIYIRQNNTWIKDPALNIDKFYESNKLFCNLQKNCVAIKDDCLTKKEAVKEFNNINLNNIINNFDTNYEKSIQTITDQINEKYNNYKNIIKKVILNNRNTLLKYNDYYNRLGSDIDLTQTISSPYENLKYLILTIKDFVKRQNYIIKYCKFFTRKAFKYEDTNWLYCIKTNYKLLPSFLLQLAFSYINKQNYSLELDIICSERGTISDDGNMWVDKHSGYVIKNIEFNSEEGYDERGYKLQSREIVEKEFTLQSDNIKEYHNNDSELIAKIINAISNQIGTNIINYNEFIINNVVNINKKITPSKENYEKKMKKVAATTAKSVISYKDLYNSNTIILTLIFILITIQTSMPNITTKKVFPGCIKSFSGYPFTNDTDKSGLTYLACVANKIKSNIEPWNSIIKMGDKTIAKNMEAIIEKYVVNNKSIIELFKKKQEYILLNPDIEIPFNLDIRRWSTFLPPLTNFKIDPNNLIGVENIDDKILASIKKTNSDILLRSILSKIGYNSFYIINSIQDVVNKSMPLLNNNSDIPFLENSCCNNNNNENTIQYFIKQDNSIENYNVIVSELNKNYKYTKNLNIANNLYYPFSTKSIIPSIDNNYSVTTIYKGIINYCKFNSDLPVDDIYKSICGEKPRDINYNADIMEIIDSFKREGKNYDNTDFISLINIINKKNIIKLDYNLPTINSIEILRNLFKKSDVFNNILEENFIEKFNEVLDVYNINTDKENESVRDFKNYLSREIKIIKTKLLTFFETNSKLSKKNISVITKCFQTFSNIEPSLLGSENINYYINFMKNNINNLITIFPNIILNSLDMRNTSSVRHWNLSQIHNGDITNLISKYYEKFVKFYDDQQIKVLLKNISSMYSPLNVLINNIYYLSNINIKEQKQSSIFDNTLVIQLLNYIWFFILFNYLDILNNDLIKQELYNVIHEEEFDYDDIKLTQIKASDLLSEFIETIYNNYKLLDYTNKSIVDNIIKSKEVEKGQITNYLKDLTDEEREIENIFKNNKLEKWGVGLQKGMTQYVQESYDDERHKLEAQAILDKKLGEKSGVTDMNREIYKFDILDQEAVDEEIERENDDLGIIPDDGEFDDEDVGGIDDDYANY